MAVPEKKVNCKNDISHCSKETIQIKKDVLKMAELAEKSISMAIEALVEQNIDLANETIENDEAIDKMELDIEEKYLQTIALYGPVADELRAIGCGLRIIIYLERIADHAVNIARYVNDKPLIKPIDDIRKMADIAYNMFKDSINAYTNNDVELANEIWDRDETVDELERQVITELLALMDKDPVSINKSMHLIDIARNLERIADYATNFAEEVIYAVKGERKR